MRQRGQTRVRPRCSHQPVGVSVISLEPWTNVQRLIENQRGQNQRGQTPLVYCSCGWLHAILRGNHKGLVTMSELRYRVERKQIGELNCAIVTSDEQPQALGVFCHGFGASGDDLLGVASELLQLLRCEAPVQLVFPAALLSLADEGYGDGRAWWKLSIQRLIAALEAGQYELVRDENPPGIEQARQALVEVIDQSLASAGLNKGQLLLGGFSQGAMLSVETACCGLDAPPAAMALFSGCLIRERHWKAAASRLSATNILQSHGRLDPILPFRTGTWLRDMLTEAGCEVEFVDFQGPHTIPWEAIEGTAKLLDEVVMKR